MSFLSNIFGGGSTPSGTSTGGSIGNTGSISNQGTYSATGTTNPYSPANNSAIAGLMQQLLGSTYPSTTAGGAGTSTTSNIIDQLLSGAAGPMSGGESQYEAGEAGQLTPAQQALTNFTANQNNLATNSTYANLGIPGSSMNTEDLNANNLASLTQQEEIDFQNEQMGLTALGVGSGMLNQAGGLNLNQQQLANQLYEQIMGMLTNPSTGSSTIGEGYGIGTGSTSTNALSSLLGGNSASGTGSGIGGLLSGGGGAGTSVVGGDLSDTGTDSITLPASSGVGATSGPDLSSLVDQGSFNLGD
jgi:hypothetical protein